MTFSDALQLIAGMMATAFGMLLTAFAIGTAGPATISQGA